MIGLQPVKNSKVGKRVCLVCGKKTKRWSLYTFTDVFDMETPAFAVCAECKVSSLHKPSGTRLEAFERFWANFGGWDTGVVRDRLRTIGVSADRMWDICEEVSIDTDSAFFLAADRTLGKKKSLKVLENAITKTFSWESLVDFWKLGVFSQKVYIQALTAMVLLTTFGGANADNGFLLTGNYDKVSPKVETKVYTPARIYYTPKKRDIGIDSFKAEIRIPQRLRAVK